MLKVQRAFFKEDTINPDIIKCKMFTNQGRTIPTNRGYERKIFNLAHVRA